MSTTTAPPVGVTSAGPVLRRVRGMVRTCGPWWALLIVVDVVGEVPWGTELVRTWGVLVLVAAAVALVRRPFRRREEAAYGGPGQRDLFERALHGDRLSPDADVEAWRRHLPLLRLRARENVLAMPWVGVVVLALAALVLGLVLSDRSGAASMPAMIASLTVVAWPFFALFLRRHRDRIDALAERLGHG